MRDRDYREKDTDKDMDRDGERRVWKVWKAIFAKMG